ncbi:MAG: polysaccharide biosynthesis tyrosine autokinase [Gammaproteobacteria bacterium]|nr:polysaccharide biosynthesis tyrosine autokinase [Gammaproteobacteria bacterium]
MVTSVGLDDPLYQREKFVDGPIFPEQKNKVQISEKAKANRMIAAGLERSQLIEEYRRIKRPLLNNVAAVGATVVDNASLIMVTSSVPDEGKTFTAVNLAMSIAMERDKAVLLVDADVAKPSISALLGIESEVGLVDYLTGEVPSLSDLILSTDVPNLRILPAGRTHPHATELLSSASMRDMMREFSSRYEDRIVIFDSPPLLAANEAAVLAELMGQIVLVVEAEKSRQAGVLEALALLNPDQIIGLVLNKCRQPSKEDYYSGYYGYG